MTKENGVIDAEYTETTKSVAVIEPPSMPAGIAGQFDLATKSGMEEAVATVTNAIEFVDRILTVALKTARVSALYDYDGAPYFSEAECMRLLRLIGGGSTQLVKFVVDREDDGNWGATAIARVTHPMLGTIEGLGYAHTTDAFLGTNAGKSRRVLDQVSRHNLRQHAYTRAKGAAIRELLDLKNRTWDDLIALGLDRGKVGAMIEHKKAKRPASQGPGPATAAAKPKSDAPAALVTRLRSFDKNKIFSWNQIGKIASEIGLPDSRALDLGKDDMQKLVNELNKRADELKE